MAAKKTDLELRRMQWDCYLLTQRLTRMMEQRLLDCFRERGYEDMSISRLVALTILFQQRVPSTAQQVAEIMGMSPVTVGRFFRALEEGGWVKRRADPKDGRAILLAPTAKARTCLSEFLGISDTLMDEAYEGIGRSELSAWLGHLTRIVGTLETKHGADPSKEA